MLTKGIEKLMKGISGLGSFGAKDGTLNIMGSKGTVTINGKTYKGNNISIQGDKVTIDGIVQEGSSLVGSILVKVEGDVESIDTLTGGVVVSGNVGTVQTTSGDVECGMVHGNVRSTSGDVTVMGGISGNVDTNSGDVTAVGGIDGSVDTNSGDIIGRAKR